ncbi:signal peptidase II [Nocardioides massiliensis]|uniref:Lipoprotein signal peptidase n=1 Tax=Nocardioides massiliensis TaxID=1325935 RepID=A0ABT9NST9_9ACTN|nr:signal peptidase II [Nocardioides massiliensis]MDP9823497.1 signal peptidase II [Nocardioides massiliensis]
MQAARGTPLTPSGDISPDRPRRTRSLLIFAGLALPLYLLDLGTKVLATEHLVDRPPVEIIGTFFTLQYALNPGAAFSMGTEYTVVLTFVAMGAALVVLWLLRRLASPGWAVALGFLLAGVLGNLTDRLFRDPAPLRGHVVDFLAFPNFPIFNVADICINVAAGVIILQAFRGIRVDGTRDSS